MPIKILPPKSFRFEAKPVPGRPGLFDVTYDEGFDDPNLVARTLQISKAMAAADSKLSVSSPDPNTIRLTHPEMTLQMLSNMMVSEFLQWAPLGQLRLAEVIVSGLVGEEAMAEKVPTNTTEKPV